MQDFGQQGWAGKENVRYGRHGMPGNHPGMFQKSVNEINMKAYMSMTDETESDISLISGIDNLTEMARDRNLDANLKYQIYLKLWELHMELDQKYIALQVLIDASTEQFDEVLLWEINCFLKATRELLCNGFPCEIFRQELAMQSTEAANFALGVIALKDSDASKATFSFREAFRLRPCRLYAMMVLSPHLGIIKSQNVWVSFFVDNPAHAARDSVNMQCMMIPQTSRSGFSFCRDEEMVRENISNAQEFSRGNARSALLKFFIGHFVSRRIKKTLFVGCWQLHNRKFSSIVELKTALSLFHAFYKTCDNVCDEQVDGNHAFKRCRLGIPLWTDYARVVVKLFTPNHRF